MRLNDQCYLEEVFPKLMPRWPLVINLNCGFSMILFKPISVQLSTITWMLLLGGAVDWTRGASPMSAGSLYISRLNDFLWRVWRPPFMRLQLTLFRNSSLDYPSSAAAYVLKYCSLITPSVMLHSFYYCFGIVILSIYYKHCSTLRRCCK